MDDFLGLTDEEMQEALDEIIENDNRDSRVCICGHSANFHSLIEARALWTCGALKNNCPCKAPRVVISVSNLRTFMRATKGASAKHALIQGITALKNQGGTYKWLVDPVCDKCKKEAKVVPVPVTQTGQPRDYATGFDVLLCEDCRAGVGR